MRLGAAMSSSSSSSSSLLLLLCLLLAKQGAVLGDQTWWHAASISYAEPNNTVGQFAESEPVPFLACSSSANSAPWAELFCHVGERCLLSDNVVQGRYHDPSATVGETQCWTKHAPPPCFPPFTDVPNLGCLLLRATPIMSWHDARLVCRSYGGDLVVPKDYNALAAYFLPFGPKDMWVGVYKEKWVDGSPVTNWGAGEPDGGTQYCARMLKLSGRYQICDAGCSLVYGFLFHDNTGPMTINIVNWTSVSFGYNLLSAETSILVPIYLDVFGKNNICGVQRTVSSSSRSTPVLSWREIYLCTTSNLELQALEGSLGAGNFQN
ncbi:uncharacterized protein [Penaeus vannamei]|uniref:uncharacterized protein n=1 Tax=Penaeus vannamei TaxID=6689 RepID=UPI00387F59C0